MPEWYYQIVEKRKQRAAERQAMEEVRNLLYDERLTSD